MVMIATIFSDTIEKEFKGQISPRAVKCLQLMADQIVQLEKALEVVHQQNKKLMKFIILSDEYRKLLAADSKKFDDLASGDNVLTERARKGDLDEDL